MFSYTDSDTDVNSSLVYEAYYDANSERLAVVLDAGYGYFYTDVPRSVYEDLVDPANSAGKVYNTKVKNKFRGGSMGYTGFESGYFQGTAPVRSVTPVNPVNENLTVGTPKGLTYAANAKVNEFAVPANEVRVTLGLTPAVASSKRSHEVIFEVDGLGNSRRTFNVDAESVDEAVAELQKATQALGLDVKVKEVTVYFE